MVKRNSWPFWPALTLGLSLFCTTLPAHADPPVRPEVKALALAAMKDDTATMERLLAKGIDVNAPVEDGRPLLVFVIAYQHLKAINFLLTHGADINRKDGEGKTPLHWAVSVSTPITQLLIEKGAEVDAIDKSGETPLYQAILHDPARALYLIDHGAGVTIKNNKWETPLHIAIFGPEEIPLVKKLIEKGADVNAVDQDGQTPLDQTFTDDMTALLTSHGAKHGMHELVTPLSSPLITTLPASPTPILLATRLRRAIESDDIYAVQTLLARGADVNAPDVDGSSPLAVALRVNAGAQAPTPPNPAVLRTLFLKGANVNEIEPQSGRTLLIRVVLAGQSASLDWLLAHGANIKTRDRQMGATAINYADDPAMIRALLKKGADIDSQDKGGYTALMTAAQEGKTEAVRALLAAHAHVNIKSKAGETALALAHIAQARNKKQNLRPLLLLLKQAGAK